MFIDVDYTREKHKTKIHLAKPNKEIVAHLSSKSNDNISLKLGNIYELNFSIPHMIEENCNIVKNPEVELLKEKMLLKLTLGNQVEWFIIDEIDEESSDSAEFKVKAYSLGYQISHSRIGVYSKDSVNCHQLLSDILEDTTWYIGEIDSKFGSLYRSFEISSATNALDVLIQASETFGAVIEWDSNTKRVSFRDIKKIGKYKGLSVDYGRLLKSISKNRTADEMVTRMYVYGNDDMSIQAENPTGQPYIEDFSFFMHPFKRDKNRKVIEKSAFMSDDLCHAILDHIDALHREAPAIKKLVDSLLQQRTVIVGEEVKLNQLKMELGNIEHRLDTAKAANNTELVSRLNDDHSAKLSEINSKESFISSLKESYVTASVQLELFRSKLLRDSNFTDELLNELKLYTISKEWKDERYIDSADLYEDALERFIELRQPKVVLTIDIENLFDIAEEQIYWDKLILGDMIKIRYPQMDMEYMARIVQIDLDSDSSNIKITIANTKETGDEMEQFKNILAKTQTASAILENNRYKFGKVSQLESTLEQWMNAELDANKRKITAGVNNQIEIGSRGIIIRNPDFPSEMIIMQSGVIALSKNNGEEWNTAITPDGIIAERIAGKIILGHKLIIEDENGVIRFTGNLIEVFDHMGDARVQMGEYESGVYGLRIDSGSLEIIDGLSKDQINKDAVNAWDSAEKNAIDYANRLKDTISTDIQDIHKTLDELDDVISGSFRDGVIDEVEAIAIDKYMNLVINEKSDIDSRFVAIYNMTDLSGSPKTALNSAKTAYDLAHNNLIIAINLAIKDRKADQSEIADVNNKFSAYKSELANLSTKFEEAIDAIAQSKANRAENNSKTYTNSKDSTLRGDLRLVSPLPTSITMNSTGITAYTSYTTDFARLDYRGLYVQGGALDVRTSTAANQGVVINGDGISGYNTSGIKTFFLNTNGHLTATSGTFSGSLNGATGTFSGSLSAASGTFSGNISASTITGGSINGSSLNTSYDITIGNNIYMTGGSPSARRSIVFTSGSNGSEIYSDGGVLNLTSLSTRINSLSGINLWSGSGITLEANSGIWLVGSVNFTNATNINWGSHMPTAVYG